MVLFNIKMSLSRKAQLYTSFPLIVVSIIFIVLLMVALHIMVISANNESEEENSRGDLSPSYLIDSSFLIRDFLMTQLNGSQIIYVNSFEDGERVFLIDILQGRDKNAEKILFEEVRENYMSENEEYIRNYLRLKGEEFNKNSLFFYGYLDIDEAVSSCNLDAFSSSDYKILPIQDTIDNNEVIVVSLHPFRPTCLNNNIRGGFTNE